MFQIQEPMHCLCIVLCLWQLKTVDAGKIIPKGGKTAFGAGVLTGALAGAAVGHLMTQNSQQQPQLQQQPAQVDNHHYIETHSVVSNAQHHTTVIRNGPVLANGCYEQTIREPDTFDPSRFSETVRMVCPPGAGVPAYAAAPASHVYPVVYESSVAPAPAPAAPAAVAAPTLPHLPYPTAAPATTHPVGWVVQPQFAMQTVPPAAATNPPNETAPHPAVTVPVPAAVPVPVPAAVPAQPAPNQKPAEVYVISRKTGYYNQKSGASARSSFTAWTLLLSSSMVLLLSELTSWLAKVATVWHAIRFGNSLKESQ